MRTVVHVVRDFGSVTEPFIQHRVEAITPGFDSQLWTERAIGEPSVPMTRVRLPLVRPGNLGDRVLHRAPSLAELIASPYRELERKGKPAVIHAHYASTGVLVGRVTNSPLVVSAYGFDLSILPRRLGWKSALRRLAARTSMLLVEGPSMQDTAASLGFAADRIAIVRISAGLDSIPFSDRDLAPDAPVRIMCCGRMVEKKGHRYAVDAFARLRSGLPQASTLILVGTGPLEPRLREQTRRLGVQDAVEFAGALERAEYLRRLATCDLLVAPSCTARNGDSEGGAPTTVLDGQATGTIVVASRHADIPFLVEDGVTGFLAAEGDVDDLIHAIRSALDARERWPQITQRARQQVEVEHSDVAVAQSLQQAYAAAVS